MAMHSATPYAAQQPSDEQLTPRNRTRRPAAVAVPSPVSSVEPQGAAPRRHPDDEAMLLMMKVVERVEVAKSFAKIAAGIVTVSAAHAAKQLRGAADAKMVEVIERDGPLKAHYSRIRKIARAAAQAAVHVATHRPAAEEESAG